MAPLPPPPPDSLQVQTSAEEEVILCGNCVESVGPVHIHCAECKNPTVQLCLQCFSCGAECGSHEKTHSYKVKNTGGVSLFSGGAYYPSAQGQSSEGQEPSTSRSLPSTCLHGWSSNEETILLDMVERFNLGNWEDITRAVNPRRTSNEVKQHYDQYYLRGRIGQATVPKLFSRMPKVTDHTASEPRQPLPEPGLKSPPIRQTVCKLNPDDLRLLAYMPHRDDFEKEWNNDAESLISGLLLMPDDDDLDKAVKLAQVDMYVREVRRRRKRKGIARDYDLVPKFFKQEKPIVTGKYLKYSPAERLQMKSERDMQEKLKKVNQYMPSHQFHDLIQGLMKEKLLKERIEELQKYRKNGIKTLEEGVRFVEADTKRSKRFSPTSPLSAHERESSIWTRLASSKDAKNDSVSTQETEKLSADGTESGDGRKSWQSNANKNRILSQHEKQLCIEEKMHMGDYLMVKMAVFKEHVQKSQGVPLRTNVKQDTVDCKETVGGFLKEAGWLPLIG